MSGATTAIFSRRGELEGIRKMLSNYLRLPFSVDSIPGALMEAVLAQVRGARVLPKYDFVDVVSESRRIGWQVKSTQAGSPLTWKRAKIPGSRALIAASESSDEARQQLGNALIHFCNQHAHHSFKEYKVDVIGYSRLILKAGGEVIYFEKALCTRKSPDLFNPADFRWKWSTQKLGRKKEQLSALHGTYLPSGEKWFAWHGRGENQLHFPGEKTWWPEAGAPHSITFQMPSVSERLSYEQFTALLASFNPPPA